MKPTGFAGGLYNKSAQRNMQPRTRPITLVRIARRRA
jgi:hypothetical protein